MTPQLPKPPQFAKPFWESSLEVLESSKYLDPGVQEVLNILIREIKFLI